MARGAGGGWKVEDLPSQGRQWLISRLAATLAGDLTDALPIHGPQLRRIDLLLGVLRVQPPPSTHLYHRRCEPDHISTYHGIYRGDEDLQADEDLEADVTEDVVCAYGDCRRIASESGYCCRMCAHDDCPKN